MAGVVDLQKKQEILALAQTLPGLDYYQVLKVDRKANLPDIKKAFFRESQAFHPDRYYSSTDQELKDAVMAIYKRVAESYGVLRDPDLRPRYDAQLAAGAGPLRLDRREMEKKDAPGAAEPVAKNMNAKRYLQLGLMAFRKGDWSGAEMNLQFALKYEPGNEGIQKKLKEAQDKKKTAGSDKDPYKIA